MTALVVALLGTAAYAQEERNLAPGTRIRIEAASMPAPFASPSVANPADRIRRPANATLRVPQGFTAQLWADNVGNARTIVFAANGDALIADSSAGHIGVLRDADRDGRAEQRSILVEGFERPFGLAIRPEGLYVADTAGVWRLDYQPGDLKARGKPVRLTPQGALGPGTGHWTRSLAFHPDGERFYVSVGSRGNIGEEPSPRATIQEFRRDGSGQATFASGLRNAIGIAFYPGTPRLYAAVNERDGLGDELVPDYLTLVERNSFHGWPYAYVGGRPQPGLAEKRPDLVARSVMPQLLIRSHSAPIHLAFYDGTLFPERYRGGAFMALQGSWNADKPRGYLLAFAPFVKDARTGIEKPAGDYEVFASGFWVSGSERATIWGKPAGVAVAPDGALFLSDDVGGTIWRFAPQGR
ncbi:MAG: PQQ-dependent sugar dehydrogenase [Alphaproteobacteria bacterium]|nr:PQQ-dependent sugar dehydrogenase [Alphaproteobacteria bacterium]MCW5740605.1 PQQ-dependent sugar dehydrogenase [Alphaproteobacteria bacterium]